jgi:hypothetical protein
MWVYRHPLNNLVLFDYRKGRGKSGNKEILSSFKGTIQCDGATEYALGGASELVCPGAEIQGKQT